MSNERRLTTLLLATRRSLLAASLPMFYLFHGPDTHTKKETLAKLKTKLGDPNTLDLNTTRFSGIMRFADLRQACDAMPFLSKARLVIVEGLFAAKPDKKFIKELTAYLSALPDTTRLVFLEEELLPKNRVIVKLAEKGANGYVKAFEPPKGSGITRWISKRVEEKNGRISPHAAHILATEIGGNLQILENELEKLTLYKGEETIESGDVALLSPYAAEASIFDFVDALGNRNAKGAAVLLQKKLSEGTDPFYLFAMIVRQFRLLIQVKEVAKSGKRPPAIAQELKLHSFVVGKLYQQSGHFSLAQLEQIYRHLLDIDIGVKTGKNDMTTALTLLTAGLSVAA